jgi:hypothetical protein
MEIQRVMGGADKEDREAAQNLQLNWKNGTIAKRQATALAQWLHAARASAINLTISDHSPSCEASSIVSMLPEDGSDAYFAPPVAGPFFGRAISQSGLNPATRLRPADVAGTATGPVLYAW